MKNLLILCCAIFVFAGTTHAETISIDWKVDNTTYATNTCELGGDLIIPTTNPTKYGYTFAGWTPYVFLEYIESTGTQYIDTGWYLPADKDNFELNIVFTSTSISANASWKGVCGVNNSSGQATKQYYMFQFDANATHIVAHNNDDSTGYTVGAITQWTKNTVTMSYNNGTTIVTYNGSSTTITAPISERGTRPLHLFKTSTSGSLSTNSSVRVYSFSVKVDDKFVINYVPAKRISDNAIGMYDTVSGQFFTNAGTGEFIAGPER